MDSWAQNITRFIALNAIGKFCKFNCDLFSTISGVSKMLMRIRDRVKIFENLETKK